MNTSTFSPVSAEYAAVRKAGAAVTLAHGVVLLIIVFSARFVVTPPMPMVMSGEMVERESSPVTQTIKKQAVREKTQEKRPQIVTKSTATVTEPVATKNVVSGEQAAAPILAPRTASDLNNPKPSYPAISKRNGEQGTVMLRVLVSTEGKPEKVDIIKSSGYPRLDNSAYDTVLNHWRFHPGKKGGQPVAMVFNLPVNFTLTPAGDSRASHKEED